jgi:ribosome-associated protein YbcJ (S4-like RNA binding protein)
MARTELFADCRCGDSHFMSNPGRNFHIRYVLDGASLAQALKQLLVRKDASWSHVKQLVARRHVHVNGNLCTDEGRRLRVGDVVKVFEKPLARPIEAGDVVVRVLPVVHGSGDCAVLVREELLARPYDCLAVPLPPAFQEEVEAGIAELPRVSLVLRRDLDDYDSDVETGFNYVPIDPCQPVIAALRAVVGERVRRAFIDLDTPRFEAKEAVFPDPYALKRVRAEAFAAAVLPSIPEPTPGQHADRLAWMAHRLRQLEKQHDLILFVCSFLDWPGVREAYQRRLPVTMEEAVDAPVQRFDVDPKTLAFLLGELPFLTGLQERGRIELTPDDKIAEAELMIRILRARAH